MTLLNVVYSHVDRVVSTWQVMPEFASKAVLQVNQGEDIVENRWARSGWCRVLEWG